MMVELHVPDVEREVGLAVRPDVLWLVVAAKVEDTDPGRAVRVLHDATRALHERLTALHPEARLVPGKLDLRCGTGNKSGRSPLGDALLDGVGTIPLDPKSDFWARAELSAAVVEAVREVARALAKAKPPVTLGWRNPVGRIADVEPHREALTARHRAQLRALGDTARAVTISDWDLPIEVGQLPVSLEVVRLVLVPQQPAARR